MKLAKSKLKGFLLTNALAYLSIIVVFGETFNTNREDHLPGACIIKLITAVIYGFRNRLECLSLASLSSVV